jgi:hypothetical protein
MKKLAIIFALLAVFGCKSKKATVVVPPEPKVKKVEIVEIAPELKDKAYDLGRRVLMTCNISKFRPFNTDEATASVIKNMTKERLTKTCLNSVSSTVISGSRAKGGFQEQNRQHHCF